MAAVEENWVLRLWTEVEVAQDHDSAEVAVRFSVLRTEAVLQICVLDLSIPQQASSQVVVEVVVRAQAPQDWHAQACRHQEEVVAR